MDIINHSAGLITSFHMLDAVARVMFTPYNEITFTNTNTNTISRVLCIAYTFVWCLVVNYPGETVPTQLYPKMMRNFRYTFVLLYFGHYIIFGHAELYGHFGFKFAVTII